MQKLYTNTISTNVGTGLARWIVCKWDMTAILSLMIASAAYSVISLVHAA